jgi:hypothetical protein
MPKAYLYNLTDTWNAGGTTFNAIKMNVTDSASAAGSLLLNLQVGSTTLFSVSKAGIAKFVDRAAGRDLQIEPSTTGAFHRFFSSNTTAGFQFENSSAVLGTFSATTGLGIGSSADLFLARDAANTLAQRNGTNAQAFRLYETFTDVSNYSRLSFSHSGGNFQIKQEHAGTGTVRELQMGVSNGVQWKIINGGHFLAGADNTYDIGASGANRPRAVYVAGDIVAGAVIQASGQVRGATLRVTDGVTAPAAVAGQAIIYVDTADGDLKIIFADGTIKTIVTDT